MSRSPLSTRLSAAFSALAVAATCLVTAAAPAAATPGAVPAAVSRAAVIIDPVTGREIRASVQHTVTDGAGLAKAGLRCATARGAYVIAFAEPYSELLRWSFRHTWCWQNKSEAFAGVDRPVVVSITLDNQQVSREPTIRAVGAWAPWIGRYPAPSVRVTHDGMRFDYCPFADVPTLCLASFDPLIDVLLLPGGQLVDRSVL